MITSYEETVNMMLSSDYKERFKAEYYQTKLRYEKLKKLNTQIEAYNLTNTGYGFYKSKAQEPKHDCPYEILRTQQSAMGDYLHSLEVRAEIEGIDIYGDSATAKYTIAFDNAPSVIPCSTTNTKEKEYGR